MRKHRSLLCLIVFVLSASSISFGQTNSTDKVDEKTADVAITARVEAKELTFEVVPTPKVEFFGRPERKTEWSSVRENLPDSVEPRVTYRNIGITLKIVSVFADIDRIVDEALGIVPRTDDQSTKQQPENQTKPER